MRSKKEFLMLFCECIPVKGFNRSIIYDLNRNDYDFIPNELVSFIEYAKGKELHEIYNFYGSENKIFVKEYLHFLENKEYIFWIDEDEIEFFPSLENTWHYPSIISNCVIEVDPHFLDLLDAILLQLKAVQCHYVTLRFVNKSSINIIKTIIEKFEGSNIKTIQLILIDDTYKNYEIAESIMSFDKRIIEIYIIESTFNFEKIFGKRRISFSKVSNFQFNNSLQQISTVNFRVNIYLFFESLNFNTYYNKKVSISKEGEIKNCLLLKNSFGNIKDENLRSVVDSVDFQLLWNANKDKIEVCKDCEFRYMCVDSSPLIFDINKQSYNRFEPCKYNPYENFFYD